MSKETVEVARRGIEQFNQDLASKDELSLDLMAPDIVFDNSNAALDGAVYRGDEGRIVSVGREDVEVVARAAMLITVGDGKITYMNSFQSKADALEAVGLPE